MPQVKQIIVAQLDRIIAVGDRNIAAAIDAEPIDEDHDEAPPDEDRDGDNWFERFTEAVSQMYEIMNPSPSAISSYLHLEDDEEDPVYHVTVYPSLVEISGAPHLPGDIRIQLDPVFDLFDEVQDVSWMFNSPERGALSVSGIVDGRDVWLELLDHAPDDEEPTSRMLPSGAFEEIPLQPSSEEIKRAAAKKPPHVVKPDKEEN